MTVISPTKYWTRGKVKSARPKPKPVLAPVPIALEEAERRMNVLHDRVTRLKRTRARSSDPDVKRQCTLEIELLTDV